MGRAYQNRKASMAKTAAAKTKVYSKYGREIYMSAKSGGIDPNGNLTLRSLIDRAKKDQVPTHVIDKAIEKAKGGGGEDYSPALYEGFGPGGSMVLIECLTDNPNRTIGDVRTCFNRTKCKLGTPGTVAHMFDHCAVFVFPGEEEATLEALLEADVDVTDLEAEEGQISVYVPTTEYGKTRQALTDAFGELEFEVDEIQYLPKGQTPLEGDDVAVMEKLMEMLNDVDDVQNVYTDAQF